MLEFAELEVEESYKLHHSRTRWRLDLLSNALSLVFGAIALPPLATKVPLYEYLLFWLVVVWNCTILAVMNWFPDRYLIHREAFIVGLSLLNKVTGVVGLRHIYMRDNSPSWPHFAYSVIGFCGQWPMHFLLSLQLSMRLKLYVLVHVAGLAFVLCANSSMASHILQVPQNRARWRAIAETMSCAVRQVRSQDTLECLEAAAAIDEEWCCVVVWTVLQVSVGFVLPALITYYIEIKDRKRFQVANHGYAPLLDSYIANAFPAVILAPFMMMLAYHRPEMLAYLI